MKGGRLLASGGQGCVFSPPLKCADASTPSGDMVSKLTTYRFAKAEISERDLIAKVDPDQIYSVYAMHGCMPAAQTEEEARENPVHQCVPHMKQPVKDGRYLLFYTNAGVDLFDYEIPFEKVIPFFEGLTNTIRGLSLFHVNNLVHMDIKPENIVAKWDTDASKFKMRYIDFGFAFLTRSPVPDVAGFKSRNYSVWPYEVRFLNTYFHEDMITHESITKFMEESIVPYHFAYPIHMFNKCDVEFYKTIWRKCQHMTYVDRVDFIAKATDVYSLGRAFSMVYYKFSKHKCGKTEAELQLPPQVLPEIQAGHEALRAEISNPFYYEFVAALMEPDPFRRPETFEVDAMYAVIFNKIRSFMETTFQTAFRGGRRNIHKRRQD